MADAAITASTPPECHREHLKIMRDLFDVRFVFDVRAMRVRDETDPASTPFPVIEMMNPQSPLNKGRPIHWEGFDGKETVTVFFERPDTTTP